MDKKFDAQLFNVIEFTIHASLKLIFRREMCASMWSETHALYTNDTKHLDNMCQDLFNTFCCTTIFRVLHLLILDSFMSSSMILMSSLHHL